MNKTIPINRILMLLATSYQSGKISEGTLKKLLTYLLAHFVESHLENILVERLESKLSDLLPLLK